MQPFDRKHMGVKGCGPGTNKRDWNLGCTAPDTKTYVNFCIIVFYMRISDAYRMLAEVCAALGDEGSANTVPRHRPK